ncbi:MAG: histidinol-phosphate transaminase [Candidatus Eremiobacteraeota bacterium]|nr:histidinol-phosphate transaminase [Candidatus Eremiobacteraeota bacterium]
MTSWSPASFLPAHVRRFEPYVPSRPDAELRKMYGCDRIFRLNNNENTLGPPPAAREVIESFNSERAAQYPSGDSFYLRHKLAEKFGLSPDEFIVGNGANEVIAFVIKTFCEQGDNIITADKTFAVYEWVAKFSGIEARLVPLRNYFFDERAILSRIDERTKIIFICNPNNPTGTYWDAPRLKRFLESIGGRQIVVVDEAYAEFVEKSDYPQGMSLIDQYPNLVVFRTFSKMYGLAGLRVGYLAARQEVVDALRRTCVVYSVNTIGQEAALAAKAALGDEDYIAATRKMVREGKEYLIAELEKMRLPIICGEGNFLMVRLPMSDMLVHRRLLCSGVLVRTMTGFRFPNHIRVSIGTREALECLVENLGRIISS